MVHVINSAAHAAKKKLLEMFSPKNEEWRRATLARGRAVIQQALTLTIEEPQQAQPKTP